MFSLFEQGACPFLRKWKPASEAKSSESRYQLALFAKASTDIHDMSHVVHVISTPADSSAVLEFLPICGPSCDEGT